MPAPCAGQSHAELISLKTSIPVCTALRLMACGWLAAALQDALATCAGIAKNLVIDI